MKKRLGRCWNRFSIWWDLRVGLHWQTLGDLLEGEGIDTARRNPNKAQLEVNVLENRWFPGTAASVATLGLTTTGLAFVDQAVVSPATPTGPDGAQLTNQATADGASVLDD